MKSIDTIGYFKTIPSSLFTSDIPKPHYSSHLHNFKDMYVKSSDGFWGSLADTTKKLLTLDTEQCPKYIFLCGCPGSGKTHIAVGLYRALVQKIGWSQGGGTGFKSFTSMVADIISGFSDNIPTRDALAYYTKNKWLFLDDFTASEKVLKKDSFDYQLFRDILLNRWDTGTVLVTTTNSESKDLFPGLEEVFGDHVMSRLSGSVVIQFPNEDLRKNKGVE